MIHSVKITNHKNESIEMILTNPETSEFIIGEGGIEGLGPEQTNINSTENQIYDGASFDSAVTPVKNIVFHLLFDPLDGNIERVRHKCYKYFPVKEPIKIEVHTDERSLYIEGYVESNLPTIFEEREGSDISVLCMDPYFKANTDVFYVIRGTDSAFQFPFYNDSFEPVLIMGYIRSGTEHELIYNGEIKTGVKIKIGFSGNIDEPIQIQNNNDQYITIDMHKIKEKYEISIEDGDYLIIDTRIGSKNLTLYKPSVINKEYPASVGLNLNNIEWVMLNPGYNNIKISTNDISLINDFTIDSNILYGGV